MLVPLQVSFASVSSLFCLYVQSLLTSHARLCHCRRTRPVPQRLGFFCLYDTSLLPVLQTDKAGPAAFEAKKGKEAFDLNKYGGKERKFKWTPHLQAQILKRALFSAFVQ